MGKWNDKRTSCRVMEKGLGACMGTAVDGYCGSGFVVGRDTIGTVFNIERRRHYRQRFLE
jgi:hypothetical protein